VYSEFILNVPDTLVHANATNFDDMPRKLIAVTDFVADQQAVSYLLLLGMLTDGVLRRLRGWC
jgi:hypothetical protein